jgi:hypothetical protein
MFSLNVIDPGLVLGFELKPCKTADKTALFHIYFQLVAIVTHVRECINYYSKDEIKEEDYHNAEIGQIKNIPHPIFSSFLIKGHLF